MFNWNWITATGTEILMVLLSGIGIFIALLIFTRIAGLRSFSKISSFDYSITVAFGSIMATTLLSKDPSLLMGAAGLAVLYLIQYVVSRGRRLSHIIERIVDNEPLLIMAGEQVISEHLTQARMTEDDLKSKLRMAGITHPEQVFAVVLESTGDVAVMKTCDQVDFDLFDGVRGADRLK